MILRKVARFCDDQGLLKHEGHYIVALSGGADSIALVLMMKALHGDISAAHCNFHLRGEESDRDEQFCVDFCEREDIPLHRIHFDTQSYAELHKQSIEMAARELRYRYFAQLAKDVDAEGILVAHHRDDNVETLLLNLLRGSGVDGLAAIAPKSGNIIRPLLCLSKEEILQYLQTKHQDYVTDSTNLEDDALRNKIRHHVIPLLESINPAARQNIAQSAHYLRQAKTMLDSLLADDGCREGKKLGYSSPSTIHPLSNVVKINRKKIQNAASPEFLLHHELGQYGFHGEAIDQIWQALREPAFMGNAQGIGKIWKSKEYMVGIDREELLITSLQAMAIIQDESDYKFPEEGNYHINTSCLNQEITTTGETKLRIHRYPRTADFQPSKASYRITLDADKVIFPLTYRLVQQGDRFRPFGMKGTKLVSDYLTDRKRNYLQKAEQHVLTDKNGEIIWLVGERTSENCKITNETQEIMEISIGENNDSL